MRTTPILLAGFLLATMAAADVVHLKDGRTLEGVAVQEGDTVTLVDRDRKYQLKADEVVRVESKPSFMHDYLERLERLPTDDAEAIFEFGRWLDANDWPSRARLAYEEVIDLDGDHRGARRALGYRLYEGAWLSPEEIHRRNGLVEYEGRWYSPHDLAELQKEIERDVDLRAARDQAARLNARVNEITKGFATFDKKKRQEAYETLLRVAEQANSPELRKFADDSKAYYDHLVKVLCAKMLARTEIHAVHTKLRKPISTFETTLGQAIGAFSGQSPVKIQLPELRIAEVHTTVDIPAGCR
ncbi:MAG: hypothetical protein ACT4PV_09075 [Planctomycetaceae bacterium]